MFELERLQVAGALLSLGDGGAPVGLGPLARARGLGPPDLAGGLIDRLLLGLLAVGFRSLLGAALFDLGLEALAFLGGLDLVLLELRRGVGLLGLGSCLCGLDRGFP